ncbi:CheY-like superfamily [Penicillium brevicompactum]|uniref:histidine kinase n=1 Tax=Penicillium brevicompactum TaxID=5074 RepID=A0A9W9QZ50_PENBR|nr:CheY-like superfamily [Penicillium brevicompactum]
MRIPIAVQLALLVLLTTVSGIAVLAIATWFTTYDFIVGVESQGLELVATIKASQIASNLDLLETTCKTFATRILIQSALRRYYAGNSSAENWTNSIADVQSALGGRGYLSLYQAIIYSKNGDAGVESLLNVTSDTVPDIILPYTYPNGTSVKLGHPGLGYPPSLYPNLTYRATGKGANPTVYAFTDYTFGLASALLLGPLKVNSSFSLVSLTLPIVNNTSNTEILGFMTVVASAANLQNVISSRDGLGNSGQVLLLGPNRPANVFSSADQPATSTSGAQTEALHGAQVHYVFEPTPLPTQASRHAGMSTDTPFVLSTYPLALRVMLESYTDEGKAISDLSTTNERGIRVAVGAVRPQNSLVQWILLVEEFQSEAFAPVARLRKIIIACVFGTAGAIIILVPLLTHWAVAPIRRLRAAAQKSVEPEIEAPPASQSRVTGVEREPGEAVERIEEHMDEKGSPATWVKRLRRPSGWLNSSTSIGHSGPTRGFQIPERVKERKHCVTDELTELTKTYNAMSDELTIQYARLEERVVERTRELEKAKSAAETANESKTLFIANISHELKTPLNGILGMCAVCMGEDDLSRIKKSLQVVYQSGDLLLHLLNDLLTFSKNQIDQAIQIEEKEFKISDVRSQLAIIFQNQVNEKHIDFSVNFVSGDSSDPQGTVCREGASDHPKLTPAQPRLADMILWGDQHRILQVLINLVSNSLKFTPENGKVEVRIRLVDEVSSIDGIAPLRNVPRRSSKLRSQSVSSASSSIRNTAGASEGQCEGQRTSKPNLRQVMFQFEVEDNGPGIPSHLQRRIFDPFVQGDLGLNRKYGGTGLGLSICAQLSHIMGGVILLDSKEAEGSLFTLKIPLGYVREVIPSPRTGSVPGSRTPSVLSLEDFSNAVRTPSNHGSIRNDTHAPGFEKSEIQPRLVGLSQPFFAPTVPKTPPPTNGNISPNHSSIDKGDGSKKIRVLVAEDNTVNQEVVRRMLALEEVYDVTIVKDGQEAYDTVKSNMEKGEVFDLIFMDIQMPVLDGLESTRLIRQMGYSAPIVALSAFAEESNIKDCMDCGMDMFISKPIRRPALKQVLSKFSTIIEEAENGG